VTDLEEVLVQKREDFIPHMLLNFFRLYSAENTEDGRIPYPYIDE
jgi:hypothetical protein